MTLSHDATTSVAESANGQRTAAVAPTAYPSWDALRTAHLELLTGYNSLRADVPESFLDRIEDFLRRGELTGAFIELQSDRRAAQNLLDYWTALLFRYGRSRAVAFLANYQVSTDTGRELDRNACPYPGLVPFSTEDEHRFYGREAIIADAIKLIPTQRVIALTGPAGSGKTSLIRAGLLPALRSGALPGSDQWRYIVLSLGAAPLERLARACLPNADAEQLRECEIRLGKDPSTLASLLKSVQRTVLFIDQLEDLYELPSEDPNEQAECRAVLENLEMLVTAPDVDVRVILTARFDDTASEPGYSPVLVPASRIDVPQMGTRELSQAIVGPAAQIGLKFDEGVVPDLVRALIGVPGVLPLLQFVLLELWDRRTGSRITSQAVHDVLWDPQRRRPNAAVAIVRKAEQVYQQLQPADQPVAEGVLAQLVQPGPGWEFDLKRVRPADLKVPGASREAIARVLDAFADAHLLRRNRVDGDASTRVELMHSALARYWPRLVDVIDTERHTKRQRLRLTSTADQWLERGDDPTLLWGGVLLQEAQGYPDLSHTERRFLEQSARAEQRLRRRHSQRIAAAIVGLVSLVALTSIAAALLFWLSAVSSSGQLAALAQNAIDGSPDRAMLLGLRAFQLNDNTASRLGLLSIANHNIQLSQVVSGPATTIAASPDRDLVAVGHADGRIELWSATQTVQLAPRQSDATVVLVAFEPGSDTLAAVRGGELVYWNVSTGQQFGAAPGRASSLPDAVLQHPGDATAPSITAFAISSRGDMALAASAQSTHMVYVYFWDAARAAWQPSPVFSARDTKALAFNPDGSRLLSSTTECPLRTGQEATGPCRGALRWWSIQAPQDGTGDTTLESLPAPFLTLPDVVITDISYGDQRLAYSGGSSVVLWDLGLGQQVVLQRTPGSADNGASAARLPRSVALNQDETVLAVTGCNAWSEAGGACLQGQIALWNAGSGELLDHWISGHKGVVTHAAFAGHGGLLASLGPDSVMAWDLGAIHREPTAWSQSDDARQALDASSSRAFDLDRQLIAAAGQDLVQVWQARVDGTFDQPRNLPVTGGGTLPSLAVGGTTLAAGRLDGGIVRWDTRSWSPLPSLMRPAEASVPDLLDSTAALAIGAQDRLMAAGGARGDIVVWDLGSGVPTTLERASDPGRTVTSIAVSPDGRTIATGGCGASEASSKRCVQGEIGVWDMGTTPARRRALDGHGGAVSQLAFDTTGALLASTADDGSVIVWDVGSGQLLQQFVGLPAAYYLRFLPGGALQIMDNDVVLQFRLMDLTGMTTRACEVAHRANLTGTEWDAALRTGNAFAPALEMLQQVRAPICPQQPNREP